MIIILIIIIIISLVGARDNETPKVTSLDRMTSIGVYYEGLECLALAAREF
jgi:hypothetical protein